MPKMGWIENLFSEDPHLNKIWKQWVNASFRSGRELAEIVCGDFQEEFQKRAMFLLLVPHTPLVPFEWLPDNTICSISYACWEKELDIRSMKPNLRAYAIDWLTKFIDYTIYSVTDRSQKEALLRLYNGYILQFLSVLPVEDNQAETLFQYFSINDPTASQTDMDSSGYKPLLALWKNHQINERWKILADGQMRRIIRSELQGDTTPRRPWENALRCYIKHLQSLLPKDPRFLPYGKEFLADQIYFLSSLEVYDQRLILPKSVALVLNLLSEEKFHNAKYNFIRFAVLHDNNFKIYNEQTAEAAQMILREQEGHGQVIALVTQALNSYLSIQQATKQKAEEQERDKEALLFPMRKPPVISQNENQSEQ